MRVAAVRTGELAFGQFRLDRANALLWRGQDRVVLAPKPFELLCCLVDRPGELLTKDELLDAIWSDLHVSEFEPDRGHELASLRVGRRQAGAELH